MDVPEQGRTERDRQPTVELDRLSASGNRLDTGAACTVLVVQRGDGWSIHGLNLPGQGVHLSDDSMITLAKAILARAR